MTSRLIDLADQRFGRLVVLRRDGGGGAGNVAWWLCRCDCGTVKRIAGNVLRRGDTRSCGCLRNELAGARNRTHGKRDRPEFYIWASLRQRCYNPNVKNFSDYGGRGIKVCDRWQGRDGFSNFLADMGPRPSHRHSIDRKDNNGDYCPENCHWAMRREQNRNKRTNRKLTHAGRTLLVAEWAELTGIPRHTIAARIDRYGWSVTRALTTSPVLGRNQYRSSPTAIAP